MIPSIISDSYYEAGVGESDVIFDDFTFSLNCIDKKPF